MTDALRRSFLRGRFSALTRQPAGEQAAQDKVTVSDRCLAKRRIECRACGDACDPRAIRFQPALGGIAQMRIDLDACTACRDCVPVCPVGAISVTPPAAPA